MYNVEVTYKNDWSDTIKDVSENISQLVEDALLAKINFVTIKSEDNILIVNLNNVRQIRLKKLVTNYDSNSQ